MQAKNVANIPTANVQPNLLVFTRFAKDKAINPTMVVKVVMAIAWPVLINDSGTAFSIEPYSLILFLILWIR